MAELLLLDPLNNNQLTLIDPDALINDSIDNNLSKYFNSLLLQQPKLAANITVKYSSLKGRYLINNTNTTIQPGTLLFTESPQLAVSDDRRICLACNKPHYSTTDNSTINSNNNNNTNTEKCQHYKRLFSPLHQLITVAADIAAEYEFSLSRVLNCIKFIAIAYQTNSNNSNTITGGRITAVNAFGNTNTTNPAANNTDSPYILSILSLGTGLINNNSIDPAVIELSQQLYRQLPLSYRRQLTSKTIEKLLNIFENNSHEIIYQINDNTDNTSIINSSGEGIFPLFAMIEHSCIENCAFYYNNITQLMSVYSIRSIAPAESLSINYIENYQPTSNRQKLLLSSYYFQCNCTNCISTAIDRTKSYYCQSYPYCGGLVYYSNNHQYRCIKCSRSATEPEIQRFQSAEQILIDSGIMDAAASNNTDTDNTEIDLTSLSIVLNSSLLKEKERKIKFGSTNTTSINNNNSDTTSNTANSSSTDTTDNISSNSSSLSRTARKNAKKRAAKRASNLSADAAADSIDTDKLSLLHPSHYLFHTISYCLIANYLLLKQYSKAIPLIQNRIANFELVLQTDIHWLIAAEYNQLGQIYLLLLQNQSELLAIIAFKQAAKIYTICFGIDSLAAQSALQQIKQLEQNNNNNNNNNTATDNK